MRDYTDTDFCGSSSVSGTGKILINTDATAYTNPDTLPSRAYRVNSVDATATINDDADHLDRARRDRESRRRAGR